MPVSFTVFAALAPELRNQIWRAALPDDVGPSLFFYRNMGCWCARRLKISDPGYIPETGEMAMDFRTDLLGSDTRLQMPLVSVNREARSIAKDWLEKQGFDTKNLRHHHHIMTRSFNCDSDALYISDKKWPEFLYEPSHRMRRRDLYNRNVEVHSNVTRFAVSESFMRADLLKTLPDVETWMDLRVVFVVVGAQPDVRLATVRWELEGVDGGAFIWDRERQDFDFRKGAGTLVDADAYTRIGDAARAHLPEGLLQHHNMKTLEIRPFRNMMRIGSFAEDEFDEYDADCAT
ncbi:hypothetical protein MY10362_006286 [Beauveria mimosiformis]